MHRALSINEILRLICYHLHLLTVDQPLDPYARVEKPLQWTPDYLRRKSSLLSLALTCKAFTEPALDHLWMRTLNLLEVFYPMIMKGQMKSNPAMGWIDGDVKQEVWEQYAHYARRVTSVDCTSSRLTLLACRSLLVRRSHDILFPRIRKLTASFRNMEVYTAATLFLSPSLRVLSLDMPHHNAQILNSLFKSLEATTPWLEHLGLWCYLDLSQEELKSSFSSFIARLQAIKSLDLRFSHVSSTTMTILSTVSKSLTKLSIMERGRSTTQPALSSTLSELNSVSFPLLHSLIAPFSPTLASIHARIAETSSLREISLFVNGGDRFADCVERSLATYNRCRGLKSLLIRYNPISLPSHDPTRDSITSFHLSHLSSPTFSTLTMLSIDGPVSYDLEDKDLQQISRWCPKLQIFSMVTGPIYSFIKPEPKVTLEGMITFARAMIDLDHLVLPINAYPMDVPPDPDSRIPSLSVWDSSYSWFDNPVQVAEILVNRFPFLNCNQESADKSREREGGDDPWVRRYQRSREGFATILEVIRKTRMGPNELSLDPGTGHDSSHDTNSLGDENVE